MPANRSEPSVLLETPKQPGVGVSLALHPLPILSISEHLTRARLQAVGPTALQQLEQAAQDDDAGVRVYGALLGTQSGRHVEVHNTFEVKVTGGDAGRHDAPGPSSPSPPLVDQAFFKSRLAQFKQVFPAFDFLGWYSNGSLPSAADMQIHRQFFEYNETPLFLQITPSQTSIAAASRAGELPLQLYESQLEIVPAATEAAEAATPSTPAAAAATTETTSADASSGPQHFFVRSSYKIQTGEAERIAVDHTAKTSQGTSGDGDADSLVTSLTAQQSAIRMLSERIKVCLQYVVDVRAGKLPRDHDTLRAIKAILAGMPAMDSPEFRREFLKEYNDVLLTDYLASMTKGLNALNELVDKFDLTAPSSQDGSGDRMMGMGSMGGKGRGRRDPNASMGMGMGMGMGMSDAGPSGVGRTRLGRRAGY